MLSPNSLASTESELAQATDDGLQADERDVARQVEQEEAAKKRPDPLLRESAAILADAISLITGSRDLMTQVLPRAHEPNHWSE